MVPRGTPKLSLAGPLRLLATSMVIVGVVFGGGARASGSAPSVWRPPAGGPTALPALTLAPAADARVSAARPDANYGADPELLVDGGEDPEVDSYLRFDISGVTAPVQQATLRLWVRAKGGTRDGPAVYATDATWVENALTWGTRPAPAGDALDDAKKLDSETWADYDVTPAVRGAGPIAFVLVAQSADGVIFHSREAQHPPQLVILVGDEPLVPTPTPDLTPPAGSDPTLLAAGDIADCDSDGDEATAVLLDHLPGVVAMLGDAVYDAGTAQEFRDCYDPTWGRHKSRTRPAVGNHEYLTEGAAGYFDYFGSAAGDPGKGYYSYDLGAWHIVVLNSNCAKVGGCQKSSPQEEWLRADLAASPSACTLAYWHHPRFSFGKYGDNDATRALWQALVDNGAEIVLSGHDHNYQRYAPQDAEGNRDDVLGIREFVVGTGGKNHYALNDPPPHVEASNADTFGVLKLTLHATSYDWAFVPVAGQSSTDRGSAACH